MLLSFLKRLALRQPFLWLHKGYAFGVFAGGGVDCYAVGYAVAISIEQTFSIAL